MDMSLNDLAKFSASRKISFSDYEALRDATSCDWLVSDAIDIHNVEFVEEPFPKIGHYKVFFSGLAHLPGTKTVDAKPTGAFDLFELIELARKYGINDLKDTKIRFLSAFQGTKNSWDRIDFVDFNKPYDLRNRSWVTIVVLNNNSQFIFKVRYNDTMLGRTATNEQYEALVFSLVESVLHADNSHFGEKLSKLLKDKDYKHAFQTARMHVSEGSEPLDSIGKVRAQAGRKTFLSESGGLLFLLMMVCFVGLMALIQAAFYP
jgi:hypothetical protein